MSHEEIRQLNRLLKKWRDLRQPEPDVCNAIALIRADIEFAGITFPPYTNPLFKERKVL